MEWNRTAHSANSTDDFLFSQLIPYIGSKRKLLDLIARAIAATGEPPNATDFVDLFAGTGVVGRLAKQMGFRVIANDWEPYGEVLGNCYLLAQRAPLFFNGVGYEEVMARLNALPPVDGWVTRHLCPDDDDAYDVARDRMFYMRKNGRRIDAIREQVATWEAEGLLSPVQRACLLAPLLFSACYNSNTSGLFKGFHNGWGGRTGTALYRIAADLCLRPATFLDNGRDNVVLRADAQDVARNLRPYLRGPAIAYIDPPYNQHPYGANYHVLNSIVLWDQPALSPKISGRDKAAIRTDWRTVRRSAYNYRDRATQAYARLLETLPVRWIATSYSTDGMIDLPDMVAANRALGQVSVFTRGYKRYRVSSQRFSSKPMNVEFILLTRVGQRCTRTVTQIVDEIRMAEARILAQHPETASAGG
ncbi:DNA methyltransferase [Novacetimonas hansenii]|uniref:Restriction endonuclease subunit M n=2 Tax=Novacetimonas hansenii TaxID=436 RepID=A0ABQ0SBW0_NOVHA|nr:site-specific DNA-methyltransferase (adenine-specific) [Novacetimonas hansenii ATCC 23769]GAN83362.1 DNA modification methylase [Novacetimonas hansenii JCM 7643]GBQ62436.1 DNA modification methylase [Novacetimonas hansenii NRIC 0243]GEC62658.1 restriction endonuclease subunit M [Novacetimonas hansenii]